MKEEAVLLKETGISTPIKKPEAPNFFSQNKRPPLILTKRDLKSPKVPAFARFGIPDEPSTASSISTSSRV